MKILSFIFKSLLVSIAAIILIAAIFAATNWTLVKNMNGWQEGGFDAYAIDKMRPRQIIQGAPNATPLASQSLSNTAFTQTVENWESMGGKALLVWHDGTLVLEKYAEGINPQDRSKSFSLHKSLLGLVAAQMENEGRFSLDDHLSTHIDSLKNNPLGELTVRDMLTHQSWLERFPMSPPQLKSLNLLLSDKVERTALKAKIVDSDPVFDYSNPNYQIAGAAIRRAIKTKTGQNYADYVSENIWQRIGADEAYLWSETDDGAPRFYAGLMASPQDWLKLGIMIAKNDDSVISKAAVANFLAPSPLNPHYGLGIWRGFPDDLSREYGPSTPFAVKSKAQFLAPDMVFMDGFGGQRVYISQKEKLVVVRIGDVRFDWDDTALPNLVMQDLNLGVDAPRSTVMTLKGKNERSVEVRLLPSENPASQKLLIFSHGTFASHQDYDNILTPLTQAGFQIAVPLHVDSKSHPDHTHYTPQTWAGLRLEDVKLITQHFSEDKNYSGDWVMAGHSFGSMIAQIYGGAGEPETTVRTSALGLPSHIIALSPPNEIPQIFTPDSIAKTDVPTLTITGDTDLVPGMITDWEEHLLSHKNTPKGLSTAVIFKGHDHYFNGLYGRLKDRPNTAQDQALVKIITAFSRDEALPSGSNYTVLK